jgi:hypothetical protein
LFVTRAAQKLLVSFLFSFFFLDFFFSFSKKAPVPNPQNIKMSHVDVVADRDGVQKRVLDLARAAPSGVIPSGLVLGARSAERDVLLCLVPTPAVPGELREKGAAGKAVAEDWADEHARQVARSLPGGIEIAGAFVVGDAAAGARTRGRLLRALAVAGGACVGPPWIFFFFFFFFFAVFKRGG